MILDHNIFTQDHPYKIKIKKIFKVVNYKNNDIYFIFIETHGQSGIITLKNESSFDDRLDFITKKDIMTILEKEEINIEDIEFRKIVSSSKPLKVEVCSNYPYFTVYQNDTKCLYANLFIYNFNNLTTNFKDDDFTEIDNNLALSEFKNLVKEIYDNENYLTEEKIDFKLSKQSIINKIIDDPNSIELLYTIRSYKNRSIGFDNCDLIYTTILKQDNTIICLEADFIININEIEDSYLSIMQYDINIAKNIEEEKIEEYKELLNSYIEKRNLTVEAYKPINKLEFIDTLLNEIQYNHFALIGLNYDDTKIFINFYNEPTEYITTENFINDILDKIKI